MHTFNSLLTNSKGAQHTNLASQLLCFISHSVNTMLTCVMKLTHCVALTHVMVLTHAMILNLVMSLLHGLYVTEGMNDEV